MRHSIALMALLAAGSAQAAGCAVSESRLLGTWTRHGASGFFQVFSLEREGRARVFNSWLHERPEIAGAPWALQHCELVVTLPNGNFGAFRARVVSLRNGRLRLHETADGVESVYARVR